MPKRLNGTEAPHNQSAAGSSPLTARSTCLYHTCLPSLFDSDLFFFPIFHSIRSVLPQPLTVQQQKKRLVRRVLGGKLQLQAGDARQTARQPEEMHG